MLSLDRSTLRSFFCAAASGAALTFVTACSGSMPSSTLPPAAAGAASRLGTQPAAVAASKSFKFTTLDDQADPTFNQLLGINDKGVISGYYGSGAPGHPFKGYTLDKPYAQSNYVNENYPGSAATQVTAINNAGDTAGFWIDGKNVNRGFVEWRGVFSSYTDPKTGHGTVNQILGINDSGIAVGFYTDAKNVNHAFTLDQATGKFDAVTPPGGGSAQATAINNHGDIVGLVTNSGQTWGFIRKGNHFSALSFPGGSTTQPFGVNDRDEIVGSYVDASNVMHGFLLQNPLTHAKWTSIDDPNGIGTTVVNGINDRGDMVGFYTDAGGNFDGMLVTP